MKGVRRKVNGAEVVVISGLYHYSDDDVAKLELH